MTRWPRCATSTSQSYEWIVEGDIKACFDEISHSALLDRVRARVGDKRVLALVKAFLKAGILTEDGALKDTDTGTPQGSILSPLLSNVALSVLDEYFARAPGGPAPHPGNGPSAAARACRTTVSCRYADDWMPVGRGHQGRRARPCARRPRRCWPTMGLRLSEEKTLITHIDEGLDFLGWRIQRHRKRGTEPALRLHLPVQEGAARRHGEGQDVVPAGDTNQPLDVLLHAAQPAAAGLDTPSSGPECPARPSSTSAPTSWRRVAGWIRRKHPGITRKEFRRRYCDGGWWPRGQELDAVQRRRRSRTTRYRYRGSVIPSPWPTATA